MERKAIMKKNKPPFTLWTWRVGFAIIMMSPIFFSEMSQIKAIRQPQSTVFAAPLTGIPNDLGHSESTDDTLLLDLLQKTGVDFFWREANPANGLIKDRSAAYAPCSIASLGFGLTCICIGIDHGWIPRDAGRNRILKTLQTLWNAPQGRDPVNHAGYKGFFYHMLDMNTVKRAWTSELSSIDSALLFAGIVYCKQYFDREDSTDALIRNLADSIYYRADWEWMRNYHPAVLMEWYPEKGFTLAEWRGYNEAMILYILALGSPTHPVPASCWNAWTSGYQWQTHYGYSYINFPPLFGHHYSHCWIDFRNIQDDYMRKKGITYFENSRRATLAQRAYCIANPGNFKGYGENLWGITACDGPNGYKARGAPPPQNDDGTIAPTAAGGSIVFTPEYSIAVLKNMYDSYCPQLWTQYGFRDAFNLTVNWWGPDVIGIDQGTIVIMIENYRTGRVWQRFMQNADIQRGLQRAGFTTINRVETDNEKLPINFELQQNYPNPFNATTVITYNLSKPSKVSLQIYDLQGRLLHTLVNEQQSLGNHKVPLDGRTLPSGLLLCVLKTEFGCAVRKMMMVR